MEGRSEREPAPSASARVDGFPLGVGVEDPFGYLPKHYLNRTDPTRSEPEPSGGVRESEALAIAIQPPPG